MADGSEPGDHQLEMETSQPPSALGPRFPAVLAQAAAGDSCAFDQLWRSAHPGLLRYLFVLGSGQDAEDVASDTWLKVIRGLHTFSGDEKAFRAWLTTVARNTARDRGRHLARHPEVMDGTAAKDTVAVGARTEDLALEAVSTRAALDLVMRVLSPGVAEMVVLRVVVGLDVAQVADMVGRSPGAVRVAVHRGLKSLAEEMLSSPQSNGAAPKLLASVTVASREAFTVQ